MDQLLGNTFTFLFSNINTEEDGCVMKLLEIDISPQSQAGYQRDRE